MSVATVGSLGGGGMQPGTGLCWTPSTGSHESAVHQSPSSMAIGVPARQVPALSQYSPPLQTFPSEQDAPAGLSASAGHVTSILVQVSVASQGPADTRQTVYKGANWSKGQVGPTPSQYSATSHSPALARQSVSAGASWS